MLGLTQHAVGAACGVSFQQIQKYEAAVSKLSASKLWELSRVLEVDIRYFYDGLAQGQARPRPDVGAAARSLILEEA